MSKIVLIDGENLFYGLRRLVGGEELASREVFQSYDFRGLIEELLADDLPSEILWFGARLRQYDETPELLTKTKRAIYLQSKLVNLLQSQKIPFIKVGYLRAREAESCPNCGQQEWKLLEKGVDVGVAARMMQEAASGREIVLMSADTDLLPAIRASNKSSKVMYIGYEYQPISALSRQAYATRIITKPLAQKYLKADT
ncbi:MAG: NYN domain-containing protein [Candidatus Saccharimonadales bacterium]